MPTRSAHTVTQVRAMYAALAHPDRSVALDLCHEDLTAHVAGHHALSGTHVGLDAVRRLLARVLEAAGPTAFTITSLMGEGDDVLLEACVSHGAFTRTMVHRLTMADGRLLRLQELPMDVEAEDAFWHRLLPDG